MTVFTIPEAADRLKISQRKAAQLIREGELRSIIIGRRSRRILDADLNAYLARLQAAAAANELPEPQTAASA